MDTKKTKKEKRNCWSCREEFEATIKGGQLFCPECEKRDDVRRAGADTLVIYHTM